MARKVDLTGMSCYDSQKEKKERAAAREIQESAQSFTRAADTERWSKVCNRCNRHYSMRQGACPYCSCREFGVVEEVSPGIVR